MKIHLCAGCFSLSYLLLPGVPSKQFSQSIQARKEKKKPLKVLHHKENTQVALIVFHIKACANEDMTAHISLWAVANVLCWTKPRYQLLLLPGCFSISLEPELLTQSAKIIGWNHASSSPVEHITGIFPSNLRRSHWQCLWLYFCAGNSSSRRGECIVRTAGISTLQKRNGCLADLAPGENSLWKKSEVKWALMKRSLSRINKWKQWK